MENSTQRIAQLVCPRQFAWFGALATAIAPSIAIAADIHESYSTIDADIQPLFTAGGVVAGLASGALGLYFLRKALNYQRDRQASANWPMTTGSILSSEVVEKYLPNDYGGGVTTYVPTVRYAYSAGGKNFIGDVIQLGLADIGYVSVEEARRRTATYSVGAAAGVRYDPTDMNVAVLEAGQQWGAAGVAFVRAAIFLGIGIAAFVFAAWIVSLPNE